MSDIGLLWIDEKNAAKSFVYINQEWLKIRTTDF